MSEGSENTFADDEIASLEAEYKRLGRFVNQDGFFEYILKPAEPLVWRAFRGKIHKEDEIADAQETLIKSSVVAVAFDGKKAIGKDAARMLLAELLKSWPACVDGKNVTDQIMRLNGGVASARAK